MNGREALHRFDFHDDSIFHEKVDAANVLKS